MRIAVIGFGNMDGIRRDIDKIFSKKYKDVHVESIPFGQGRMYINDHNSELFTKAFDLFLFIHRIEDFHHKFPVVTPNDLFKLNEAWSLYFDEIIKFRQIINGVVFISNLTFFSEPFDMQLTHNDPKLTLAQFSQKINLDIEKKISDICDTYLVDFDRIVRNVGLKRSQTLQYWYLAKIPFSSKFSQKAVENIYGMWLAVKEETARVIALDLDNTLWGGVVGEVGPDGIHIGGDYPGNIYKTIQNIFKHLSKAGFVLCICSKNEKKNVINAFAINDMPLSLNDFVVAKINWDLKSKNLIDISKELSIGSYSICFIDDNPAERDEVKSMLPDVIVPEMPDDISQWPDFIKKIPELTKISAPLDNKNRQYEIRKITKEEEENSTSREDFLINSRMELTFEPYGSSNKQRILQLIQKTNQFNTTTNRYTEKEVTEILSNNDSVIGVKLTDKYGNNEIIGVVVIKYLARKVVIDSVLLSCRVLGRDIESAIISWIVNKASDKKLTTVEGLIINSDRNKPVQNLFLDNGFLKKSSTLYIYAVSSRLIKTPRWFKII
jgi:FkbH-like protein